MKVKLWGVRGSVPTPLTGLETEQKMKALFREFLESGESDFGRYMARAPFWKRATYGGNTACVEVVVSSRSGAKNTRIVFDGGTGLRVLGSSLMKEMFQARGLNLNLFFSHVHADHIQGFPFFPPLYINKETGVKNVWNCWGGTDWFEGIDGCLQMQMDPPIFPVNLKEIIRITEGFNPQTVYDRMTSELPGGIKVIARKLFHPQETYGYRLVDNSGKVLVYATDNEPYDPLHPAPALLDLAKDADVLIIDCQYTKDKYEGRVDGVPRHGWGHSYPEAVAQVAVQANVKKMVLFHHDPGSSDLAIALIEQQTQNLVDLLGGKTEVIAAYEGLELEIAEKPAAVRV